MSLANSRLVRLRYGEAGRFSCEIDADRVAGECSAPREAPGFLDDLHTSLAAPLDFPPLEEAVVPGDRVALVLDRHTPRSAQMIAGVWDVIRRRSIEPEDVVVLQPLGDEAPLASADPRSALPENVRRRVRWTVHDPSSRTRCRYLASTAGGERVYLAGEAVDADVVVSVGWIAFDPLLGYRGTHSAIYPGLASADAVQRARGQSHAELGPDDARPLRQIVDEVGWLLGAQFSLQVTPAAGGGAGHVLAGAADSVLRRGRDLIHDDWALRLDARVETVVAAIDGGGGDLWTRLGAALATARRLVERGGRIVLLTESTQRPGEGLELLRHCGEPGEAIGPLRTAAPPDLLAATQLASATDWARVYLLSRLESDLVEELFMTPLESENEARRLLNGNGRCVFLEAAQFTYGEVG